MARTILVLATLLALLTAGCTTQEPTPTGDLEDTQDTYTIHVNNNIKERVEYKVGIDGRVVCNGYLGTGFTDDFTICETEIPIDGGEHNYYFHVRYTASGGEDDLRVPSNATTLTFGVEPDGIYWGEA